MNIDMDMDTRETIMNMVLEDELELTSDNMFSETQDIYDDQQEEDGYKASEKDIDDLLKNLKSDHKSEEKNMYFDEEYFADLVQTKYLPSLKKDKNGKLVSSNTEVEREVLAQMLKIVNAVINKYGIWRFERREILRSEGLGECWRSLPTFDPSRGKKYFHFLSLVAKYHLINLTKKDKESRQSADISIQPDLESKEIVKNDFFFEDLERTLFDIIDDNFSEEQSKHDKYIDLASILMEYIRENRMIVGKNDLFSTFREYGYKTSDYKKFIADIEPYKQQLFELA